MIFEEFSAFYKELAAKQQQTPSYTPKTAFVMISVFLNAHPELTEAIMDETATRADFAEAGDGAFDKKQLDAVDDATFVRMCAILRKMLLC